MIKILLISIAAFISLYSYGQAPVLDGRILPKEGTSYFQYNLGLVSWGWTYKGNDTGANRTWDFSFLSKKGSPFHIIFDKPADIGIYYESDTVNLAWGNATTNVCYWVDSSGIKIVEGKRTDGVKHYFVNNEILLTKPFYFRNSFYDTVVQRIGRNINDTAHRYVEFVKKHYDGFGTLLLGNKQFNNVSRIKDSRNHLDIVNTDTSRWYNLNYRWYSNSMGIPLMWIYIYQKLEPFEENDTLYYDTVFQSAGAWLWDTAAPSGMSSIDVVKDGFSVSQAGQYLKIENRNNEPEYITYQLYDSSGKLLLSGNSKLPPRTSHQLRVNALKQGVYVLRLTGSSGKENSHKIFLK